MDYQNLFNRDFYPTPVEVIERMMSMSDVNGKTEQDLREMIRELCEI